MPAEWQPHDATWLAWPHYRDDWPGKFEPIPWVYAEIIRHLARNERVELIVNDGASEKHAKKILDRAHALSDNVRFHRWPTNRVWTRDSGCTFVTTPGIARPDSRGRLSPRGSKGGKSDLNRPAPEGKLLAVKWRFNAWAKYPNYQYDEKIGSLMAKAANVREIHACPQSAPRRPRRRIHRRQWLWNFVDNGRVFTEQGSATQSNHETQRLRKSFCRVSGNQ